MPAQFTISAIAVVLIIWSIAGYYDQILFRSERPSVTDWVLWGPLVWALTLINRVINRL